MLVIISLTVPSMSMGGGGGGGYYSTGGHTLLAGITECGSPTYMYIN